MKKRIFIEYKYPEQPWKQYDWTMVSSWADAQMERMIKEHPAALHRRRKEVK